MSHIIAELTDFIVDLAPEAQVDYERTIFEDEHANLSVYPPLTWSENQCMALQDRVGERVSDLHVETGYLILVYVVSPEQQVAEARTCLVSLYKQIEKAERVLAEASSLGLYQVASKETGLTPA